MDEIPLVVKKRSNKEKVKQPLKAIIVNKRPSLIESLQVKLPKLGGEIHR
jgi:hypothetical protein